VPDLQTLTCPSCLVAYTAVIWYGYNEALAARPAEKSEAEIKLAKLLMSKADRPDVWVSPMCSAQPRTGALGSLVAMHNPPFLAGVSWPWQRYMINAECTRHTHALIPRHSSRRGWLHPGSSRSRWARRRKKRVSRMSCGGKAGTHRMSYVFLRFHSSKPESDWLEGVARTSHVDVSGLTG
jgi:hypothetical protein